MPIPTRYIGFSLLIIAFLPLPWPCSATEIKSSVVKIYSVYNSFSYHNPWQKKGQKAFHGSGCIIANNKILTCAHVVSDSQFIEVVKAGQAKRYTAHIDTIANETDLATLTVSDPNFFADSNPIPIGPLPAIRDEVTVYGFPDGGDKLSITKGIVSRLEHINYTHSNAYLLGCQIDASINPGNSGGPVIVDDKVVGVAFQGMSTGQFQNIGYMIPPPVINHFLADMRAGRPAQTPSLGLVMQKLENPDMRRYLLLPSESTGVLVNRIAPESPLAGKLNPGDVLLRVDGVNIANDGTIEFRDGERTYFGYLLQQKAIGDPAEFSISREGREETLSLTLNKPLDFDSLVPRIPQVKPPTYYIFGGLVFQPLTLSYLQEFGTKGDWAVNAPIELLQLYQTGQQNEAVREVVVLTQVLADSINVGFHDFANTVIKKVNGQNISRFKDLVTSMEQCQNEYQTIEDNQGFKIVLHNDTARKAMTERILKNYTILADRSPDL